MNKKEGKPITVIYTPYSPIRQPFLMIKEMWVDLLASFYLAWRLAARDIAAQYRQTALGYLWAVLPPVFTTIIWVALNSSQIVNVADTVVPYPVFAFTGTILWQIFLDSLNAPLKQMNLNRAMLTKINHPKEAIIISGLIQVLVSLLIKLVILVIVLVVFMVEINGLLSIGVILPVVGLIMLGTLFGLFLMPIGLLYKDIQEGIPIFSVIFMYLAPVVYTIPAEGAIRKLFILNPLTPLIQLARGFLYGDVSDYLYPALIVIGGSILFLFLGWIVYRLALPLLVERMEA